MIQRSLTGIIEIQVEQTVDLVQTVQKRCPVDKQFFGSGHRLHIVFQIRFQRVQIFGTMFFVILIQLQNLRTAHHLGRQLRDTAFQKIVAADFVETVYPLEGGVT